MPAAPLPSTDTSSPAASTAARRFYRHRLPVRVMHWINVVCITVLLMSGLGIFNAHPALYWGIQSDFAKPFVLIGAVRSPQGYVGVTRVAGHQFDTDGVLGVSKDGGSRSQRAFPAWATLPSSTSLANSRHWHFLFAWLFVINGIAYVLYALFSGHLRRDLLPTRGEWQRIGTSIRDHLLLRHPTGEAAKRYNVLQNLAYLVLIFGVLPLLVIGGLAMSPRLNAVITGWVDWFGGRQSARTLHFLAAATLLLFVCVHLFEVAVGGVWNQVRSMITGWYVLPADRPAKGEHA